MGRGSSKIGGGPAINRLGNASTDGALTNTPTQRIEVTRYLPGSRMYSGGQSYSSEILTAKTDGDGNITFSYATPIDYGTPSARTNLTATATFEITHGAIDGRTIGIDWSKVNSISGITYSLRSEAKQNGLKWDSQNKKWKK